LHLQQKQQNTAHKRKSPRQNRTICCSHVQSNCFSDTADPRVGMDSRSDKHICCSVHKAMIVITRINTAVCNRTVRQLAAAYKIQLLEL